MSGPTDGPRELPTVTPTPAGSPSAADDARRSDDEPLEISGEMIDVTPPLPMAKLAPFAAQSADRLPRTPAGLVDFERGMRMWPWFSLSVIALCIVVFGWELTIGAAESEEAIIRAGALHRESVWAGEVWRLLSATVLHADLTHLLGNLGMLYILGLGCEHGFGAAWTAALYVVSALVGSLVSLAMSTGPSVGASGAVFGVAAGLIVFLYRFRHRYFVRDKQIAVVLVIWATWTVATGFLTPGIDNWAHIGGFLGGAAAGAVLPPRHASVAKQ